MDSVGGVILAGGESRRMGRDKALLVLEEQTFLDCIYSQLTWLPEILVSVSRPVEWEIEGVRHVVDRALGRGPMEGLCAPLEACRSDWLLAVGCDMPLFPAGLGQYLLEQRSPHWDALVVRTRDGRLHPLCGLYAKSAAPVLERCLRAGNYRMMDALKALRTRPVSLEHTVYPDEAVANVNTPQAYAALKRRVQGPPVIAVCGVKNSGKTTLLTGLIPLLNQRGLRVAAVKHDAHDFVPDLPGTDSFRLREAGAWGVAVWSPYRRAITRESAGTGWEDMVKQFTQADVILLEGGKHTDYPKIEVVGSGVSDGVVSDPATLLAVVSDRDLALKGVPRYTPWDCDGIAGVVLSCMEK